MKRYRWIPAMIAAVMLSACTPKITPDTELTQESDSTQQVETTIIPNMQISDKFYRTLIPYKESASRGLVVSNINTKYDMKEAETGLMRISQNFFDTEKYYFQEGQYLDEETLKYWLARPNQTTDKGPEYQGLNPSSIDEKTGEEMEATVRATEAPVYLAHIIEQNYLTKTDDNKVKLAGMSIGLALNSVYYYQKEQYGEFYEQKIPEDELIKEGKKIAQEVVNRLRARTELADIPITVALFKQEERNSIVPGSYLTYNFADSGKTALGDWEDINEKYVTFPMKSPDDVYRDMNTKFMNFKQEVDKYFSNFTSIFATGFYQNKKIQKLDIEIPIQFYGTAEITGFTQYLTGLMLNHLPLDLHITVSITSVNGPEVLIIKEPNSDEPFVHIYE
ncbi:CamS family sex pheromone protein [Solibacillus sp. MA9]|uniref:CamS family sex pheromone protein n=1 Tax=Solibacillus palustris TaxID=2908203 RepID=A0ABS9UGM8_9BACL|nr:CamS family sex pheromone protein [Solibacillus sp. MA9]MCH7323080.1 CamS family sex pheromone protein [Solibacillus sp. MA9]